MRGKLSFRDQRKLAVYLSLSVSAKYNEHIAFKFTEMASSLRFEAPQEYIKTVLTSDALRVNEFELMRQLQFKVGDSDAPV